MPNRERLLELALKGLEADRAKIDDEIAQIKAQLDHRTPIAQSPASVAGTARKKRRMSAAARKKISDAMKRRYAAMRTATKK